MLDHLVMTNTLCERYVPNSCEIVGRENVKDICRFILAGAQPSEVIKSSKCGKNADLGQYLAEIAAVVIIIKNCIDIYILVRDELGKSPSTREYRRHIKERIEPTIGTLPLEEIANDVHTELSDKCLD